MTVNPQDEDWSIVARARSVAPRVEAMLRIAARCEAGELTEQQAAPLDVACARFVDHVVRTGDVHDALDRATRPQRRWFRAAAPPTLPARPDTGGPHARGPIELITQPYEVRHVIPPFLQILAVRSHANPNLARWLFEAAKLWAAERGHALAELARARVEPAVFRDGVESLIELAIARPEQGRDILPDLAEACRRDPEQLVYLVDRLARDPAAADVLAERFSGEHAEPLAIDATARARLLELARDAPSGARAYALALLGATGRADDLAEVVTAALADPAAHVVVIEQAARVALAHALSTPALAAAASACTTDGRGGTSYGLQQAAETVDTLARSLALVAEAPPRCTETAAEAIVEGPFTPSRPLVAGDRALVGTHRVRRLVPEADWRTCEDELGLAIVGETLAAYRAAPVRFAIRAAGGSGARRELDVAGVHGRHAILVIKSPFARESGWGNDNYVLGHDAEADTWVAYRRAGDELVVDRELARDALIAEEALPVVCFGEAVVWCEDDRLRIVTDTTPYHLDDWTMDPEVSAAMEARRAARAREPASPRVTLTERSVRWRRGPG